MFIIPTYLDKSDINGLGVFTSVPVQKGETVWFFDSTFDRIFTEEQLLSYPEAVREYIYKRGYLDKRNGKYLLGIDHDGFTNHSDNPNIVEDPNDNSEYTPAMIAARDIAAGEELLPNYYEFIEDGDIQQKMSS